MDRANDDPAHFWRGRQANVIAQPFAMAVSQSAIPTVIADTALADTPIIFANASFLRLTGWEEEEVLGRNLRFLNGIETDAEAAAGIEAAVAAKTEVSIDIRLDRKAGAGFWVRLDMAPIFDPDGRARLLFVTLVDVTDRVSAVRGLRDAEARFESRVEERTAALETALERTELLSREVTHRTKNALAVLAALIEAKRRAARDDREAEVLGDIAQRVRAVSRLQAFLDGVGAETEGIDLQRFLADLVQELDAPAAVRVVFGGAPGIAVLPPSALAIALCVTELVLNAQKHGFPGGGSGTVRVTAAAQEGEVILSVADDGVGLPEGFRPEQSQGLGMLVVIDQSRKLGGRLSFGAGQAGGARFDLAFPP